MGKLTWGSLIAVLLLLGFAPTANAVEVPPTAECRAFMKNQIDSYYEKYGPNTSAKQEKKITRLQAIALEEAGCISEALPLYKKVETKPYSEQCQAIAPKADRYWTSSLRRLSKVVRPFMKKVAKPHDRRIKRIKKRIDKLRDQGRNDRAATLVRKRKKLNRKYRERERAALTKLKPVYYRIGYDSVLITSEITSLRCIGSSLDEDGINRSPVGKVVKKHFGLIFISIFFLMDKYGEFDSPDSGSSSRSSRSMVRSLELPLITLSR
ncbi:MAG: hypothetical protein WBP55_10770 [Solirubrobacterales bacterium]